MSAYLGNHFLNNNLLSQSYRHILPKLPASTLNVTGNKFEQTPAYFYLPNHFALPEKSTFTLNVMGNQREEVPACANLPNNSALLQQSASTLNARSNQCEEASALFQLSSYPETENFYLSPSLFNTPYSFAFTQVSQLLESVFMGDLRLQNQLQKVYLERLNSGENYPVEQASHAVLEAIFREAGEINKELQKDEKPLQGSNKRKAEHLAQEVSPAIWQARMEWLQRLVNALFVERHKILQNITQQSIKTSAVSQIDQESTQNNLDDFNADTSRAHKLFKSPLRYLLGLSKDEKKFELIFDEFYKELLNMFKDYSLEKAKPSPNNRFIGMIKNRSEILYEAFFAFYQEEKMLNFHIEDNSPFVENWREIDREFVKVKQEMMRIISQEKSVDQEDIKFMNLHLTLLNENFFRVYGILNRTLRPSQNAKSIFEKWNNINLMFIKMSDHLMAIKCYKKNKKLANKRLIANVETHINLLHKSFFIGYQQKNSILSSKAEHYSSNIV